MADEETHWPDDLFADLDRSGPVPLYYQVSTRLEGAIHDGTIPAGARLENEIAIGQRLGLSRPTVRRAIQELVDKGLLVRRRGIGTQVGQPWMGWQQHPYPMAFQRQQAALTDLRRPHASPTLTIPGEQNGAWIVQ